MLIQELKKGIKVKCLIPVTLAINTNNKGQTKPLTVFDRGKSYKIRKDSKGYYLRYKEISYYFCDYRHMHNQFSI